MSAGATRIWPLRRPRLGLRWARRAAQVSTLLLFFYLAIVAVVPLPSALPVDLFFRIDPLLALAASLAGRAVVPTLVWAVPVAVSAIVLGRAFCGWLCPLGTTVDLARWLHILPNNQPERRQNHPRLRPVRQILLGLLLLGALFGVLLLATLDPITLYYRAITTAFLPGLNRGLTAALVTLFQAGVAPDAVARLDELLRPAIIPTQQISYRFGILFFSLFLGVIALDAIAPRFWCRYICPLGALLGLGARLAPLRLRVAPTCDRCGHCLASCKMAAIAPKSLHADPADCVECFDCVAECPRQAISVAFVAPMGLAESRYSPSRRRFLVGAGLGIAGVAVLRTDATSVGADEYLIRPPGARADFVQRCVRCSECVKVCPTGALQPSGLEGGWEALWSPVLTPRIGQCDYACNACGRVCPTGAIQPLSLADKRQTVIGTAYIDESRCIPWADQKPCIVCEEMCPVPRKAIVLDAIQVTDKQGMSLTVKRPRVERERCIGCGICETRCPLPRQSAIRVYAPAASPRERDAST